MSKTFFGTAICILAFLMGVGGVWWWAIVGWASATGIAWFVTAAAVLLGGVALSDYDDYDV
jgi:hypothetical protein